MGWHAGALAAMRAPSIGRGGPSWPARRGCCLAACVRVVLAGGLWPAPGLGSGRGSRWAGGCPGLLRASAVAGSAAPLSAAAPSLGHIPGRCGCIRGLVACAPVFFSTHSRPEGGRGGPYLEARCPLREAKPGSEQQGVDVAPRSHDLVVHSYAASPRSSPCPNTSSSSSTMAL